MATGGLSKYLFVAAIDIGTTYSGYAFASTKELKKVKDYGPTPIETIVWNSGSRSLLSSKAPTALLLKPDKTFQSFGYMAENDYSDLVSEEEDDEGHSYKDYYYFHRFKMDLHNNQSVRETSKMKDVTGKDLPTIDVFSHSIRFLKDQLYDTICTRKEIVRGELNEGDIQYVLTVPAVWDEKAKEFMQKAARNANIAEEHLMIITEPEAASLYCQHIDKDISLLNTYLMVDLGGVFDVTIIKKKSSEKQREVMEILPGTSGGNYVDHAFGQFLSDIVGTRNLDTFKDHYMEDNIDICRQFEGKKRCFAAGSKSNEKMVYISVPRALESLVKADRSLKGMDIAIKRSPYAQQISYVRHKLHIPESTFSGFFQPTIDCIITLTEKMFFGDNVIDAVVLVGGFAENTHVQTSFKEKFSRSRVFIPEEGTLAVLKGASAVIQI
ncbi:heat shock 70 kDa protein 12A-like [Argopecten irradians]|uniref:heat shock 70 kDa protein 12A-like n=1 Tax=Argopecten irradians TaxID=31199 RepID=UPI003721E8E2